MNLFNFLSNLSSIITCVLFIFFLIGKCFTIKRALMSYQENFTLSISSEKINLNIVDSWDVSDNNTKIPLILSSNDGLIYVKCYKYRFNESTHKFKKGDLVYEYHNLKKSQGLEILSDFPEGYPHFILEYLRFDYVKCVCFLAYNGKNGFFVDNVSNRLTFRAFLYYLTV